MEEIALGKYTLIEKLGQGSFSTVYKARDGIGHLVAVKILKPGWSDDPEAIERFRREVLAGGSLFHPRIATILEIDEVEGWRLLVMRSVDSASLGKAITERGSLPWKEALEIISQVAEGLDYAHRQGFIHRDIKPANILISEKEGAVLTDFGLVKAAQTSGVMLGTPSYIPTEVWGGKPTNLATDVYILACVFFEMITGEVLFSGDSSPEVMTKHVLPGPQFPGAWPEGVPEGIFAVLHKALNRQAEQRFTNAGEFAKALGIETMPSPPSKDIVMPSPQGEREVQPPPSNLPPRHAVERGSGGEVSRKTPAWLWVLIGVVVVSVLLVVGGLLNNAFNSPRSNPTAVIAQGIGSTQVSSKDGTVMVYVPAGKFIMGSETYSDEKPQRTINQEAFWIDQTEVTNAMYARCMESGTCRATGSGRTTISGYENYPVVVNN
jgi:serine/threonine protein kinase